MIKTKDAGTEQFIVFSVKELLEQNGGIIKVRFQDKDKEKWFIETLAHRPSTIIISKEGEVIFEAYDAEDEGDENE